MASGGFGNMQNINGRMYEQYSPDWYGAQRSRITRGGYTSGAAQGQEMSGYMDNIPASLRGLMMGDRSGASTSSSSGRTTSAMPFDEANFLSDPEGANGPASAPHAAVAPLDFTASNAAAFATAKDQAAQTTRASLNALSGELQSRGMGGGGYEAGQIGGRLANEANTIGAAGRAQAMKNSDLSARAASENYQGAITQRGQDIGATEARANRIADLRKFLLSSRIGMRGQDIGLQEHNASLGQDQQRLDLDRLRTILAGLRGGGNPEAAQY